MEVECRLFAVDVADDDAQCEKTKVKEEEDNRIVLDALRCVDEKRVLFKLPARVAVLAREWVSE